MLVRESSAEQRLSLDDGWTFASVEPGRFTEPGPALDQLSFADASVPGTVAQALARASRLDLSRPPPLDAQDHWFRCPLPRLSGAGTPVLALDGLATLAEVFVGKTRVLSTENMFRQYEVELGDLLEREEPVLSLRFRALTTELAVRRPRPRWRTRLVDQQQLRWIRTTLVGRTPGFCPSVPPVGPYRGVRLELRRRWRKLDVSWVPEVDGSGGFTARVAVELRGVASQQLERVEVRVDGAAGSGRAVLALQHGAESTHAEGVVRIEGGRLWWPHTHGESPLSGAELVVTFTDGEERVGLGKVGFRRLERDGAGEGFGLRLNGEPVFCRGGCWTAEDVLAPGGPASPRQTLELARSAGMNMIRVGGTSLYESDAFYDLCDELGILVWQDFMFANMDYPVDSPPFLAEVRAEVDQLLSRLEARPCLATLCGGSEVEQQAAMLGQPSSVWQGPLTLEVLPTLAAARVPVVPYLTSTPTGGAMPFHTSAGVTHYYGVGAYERPFTDIRASDVGFASECLAFANVPDESTLRAFLGDLETPPHHPRWKERVPRDRGVGWDFDDTRDHYVGVLFGVDPRALRHYDVERYLALGRVATGEVMDRVFSEWRRTGSRCRGGLVWWLKDFWAGAGWGVIDALGRPKACYYALARVLSPVALLATDEGLQGYALHAVNDTATELETELEVALFRQGGVEVARGSAPLRVPARGAASLGAEQVLGRFHDATFAYRFGPPGVDLMVAWLRDAKDGRLLGRAFGFPLGMVERQEEDLGLTVSVETGERTVLCLKTQRFAQAVAIDIAGWMPADNHFHLAPGEEHRVPLAQASEAERPIEGHVQALNSLRAVRVVAPGRRG